MLMDKTYCQDNLCLHDSAKVPHAWNGKGSWFAYEEIVHYWVDMTENPAEKQGPAFRNRCQEKAFIYKTTCDRIRIRS